MGSRIGILRVAANRLNVPFEAYMAHIENGEKHCGMCRLWWPLAAFHVDNSRGNGRASICKECRAVDDPQHPWRGKNLSEKHRGKISKTLKERYEKQVHHRKGEPNGRLGKKHSRAIRKKISQRTRERTQRGEEHYAYLHGRAQRNLDDRRSADYTQWRLDVFERDNYMCQSCGDDGGGNLNAHHLKPFSEYPDLRYAISNGITLCEDCHYREHYS